jgi:hypothetical protein
MVLHDRLQGSPSAGHPLVRLRRFVMGQGKCSRCAEAEARRTVHRWRRPLCSTCLGEELRLREIELERQVRENIVPRYEGAQKGYGTPTRHL